MRTTHTDVVDLLDAFCDAFTRRDAAGVLRLFAPRPDVTVVTSEDAVLRNRGELESFLLRYAQGRATYSWQWEHVAVAAGDDVAWLLAEGFETASRPDGAARTPYRMTMLCLRSEGGWRITQAHGSSPHHA